MTTQNKWLLLSFVLFLTFSAGNAQPIINILSQKHFSPKYELCLLRISYAAGQRYDWTKIIQVDIDQKKYPGKYKAIEDILNGIAADTAGRQIFENIAKNNPGKIVIKDKDDVMTTNATEGDDMFSADYGVNVIKQDMTYDPIDNDLVINFSKSGEMLSFDEQSHQFFKISLNSVVATELESAGQGQSAHVRNCRLLISKMTDAEKFLFNNYKDLMGEKFSADEIEHCRNKTITIYNFKKKANITYTFTNAVTDALKEYRGFADDYKINAYSRYAQAVLAQKYTDKIGEPHRSKEPVFTLRLGQNRSRSLQFGPVTGTDYISLGSGAQNEYKNLSVYYDDEHKETVDNVTVLNRIREEYIAQLKYNTEALNSEKMLAYADKLKKYFNSDYKANTDYKSVAEKEVAKVMHRNPYLEGASEVIVAEMEWAAKKKDQKK